MTVLHLGSDMASPCRHCTGTVVHFRAEREAVGSPWDIVATCVACRLSRSTWAWWPGGDRKGMPFGQCTDEEPTAELLRRHLNVIERDPLPAHARYVAVPAGEDVTHG